MKSLHSSGKPGILPTGMAGNGLPKVLLVGGLDFNIPKELYTHFNIVKHLSQKNRRIHQVPNADYIFVISDWANHSMVETVKKQTKAPVIWLRKGWAAMKEELSRRSILPPEGAEEAPPEATPAPSEGNTSESGYSEDELWKIYGDEIIQAIRNALKAHELVKEDDLLEILALAGPPKEDCKAFLESGRLQMKGLVEHVKDGVWRSMIGKDGHADYGVARGPFSDPTAKRMPKIVERANERARLIAGLSPGPYTAFTEIGRKMQKYREFHNDGVPIRMDGCRRLIKRAVELGIVNDEQKDIRINFDPEVSLTPVEEPEPELPLLPPAPPVEPEPIKEVPKRRKGEFTQDEAKEAWLDVVKEIKSKKRHIATVLEGFKVEWLQESQILCCLIPPIYMMYQRQVESTDNWGMILAVVRARFGPSVMVRFLPDNGIR